MEMLTVKCLLFLCNSSCSRKDPTQLRAHLKKCLLENTITEFPQVQRKRKANDKRIEWFNIIMQIHQPEIRRMIHVTIGFMI